MYTNKCYEGNTYDTKELKELILSIAHSYGYIERAKADREYKETRRQYVLSGIVLGCATFLVVAGSGATDASPLLGLVAITAPLSFPYIATILGGPKSQKNEREESINEVVGDLNEVVQGCEQTVKIKIEQEAFNILSEKIFF